MANREKYADKSKYTEHTIEGSVPKDEWEKFLKKHFVPGKKAAPSGEVASPSLSRGPALPGSICGWLGCPNTHPISHGPLQGCSIDTEDDGSITIHCYYLLASSR
jgi:hypothetical protein